MASSRKAGPNSTGMVEDDNGGDDVRPVFFTFNDVFPERQRNSELYLTHEEVYISASSSIAPEFLRCIQFAGGLCRIYVVGRENRIRIITSGIVLRGKLIQVRERNPFIRHFEGVRLTIKGLPFSADDSIIHAALQNYGCEITDINYEQLRVNGKLTQCYTGNHFVFVKAVAKPIPTYNIKMGKFNNVRIYYRGQKQQNEDFRNGGTDMRREESIDSMPMSPPGHVSSMQAGSTANMEDDNQSSTDVEYHPSLSADPGQTDHLSLVSQSETSPASPATITDLETFIDKQYEKNVEKSATTKVNESGVKKDEKKERKGKQKEKYTKS